MTSLPTGNEPSPKPTPSSLLFLVERVSRASPTSGALDALRLSDAEPSAGRRLHDCWQAVLQPHTATGERVEWSDFDDEQHDIWDAAATLFLATSVPSREQVAREVWERFAPSHVTSWEDESHKAEYLRCADAVLALPAENSASQGEDREAGANRQAAPDEPNPNLDTSLNG